MKILLDTNALVAAFATCAMLLSGVMTPAKVHWLNQFAARPALRGFMPEAPPTG